MRNILMYMALAAAVPALGAVPRVVPTFESLGIYWTPPADPGAGGCALRFRKRGDASWRQALPNRFLRRGGYRVQDLALARTGPPNTMNPSSASESMNRACSSQPSCSRRGRE